MWHSTSTKCSARTSWAIFNLAKKKTPKQVRGKTKSLPSLQAQLVILWAQVLAQSRTQWQRTEKDYLGHWMISQAIQEQLQQIFSLKRSIQLLHEEPHTSAWTLFLIPCGPQTQRKRSKAVRLGYHEKKAGVVISQHPYSSKNWK